MGTREVGLDKNGDLIAREQGVGTLVRVPRADVKDVQAVADFVPIDLTLSAAELATLSSFTNLFPNSKGRMLFLQAVDASTGAPADVAFKFQCSDGAALQDVTLKASRLDLHLATAVTGAATNGLKLTSVENTGAATVRVRGAVAQ